MSDTATAPGSPYTIYWVTWGILLVITVAMLLAEKFHLPRLFLVLFLVVFMLVKATMITGNFMHLRYEQRNLAFIVAAGLLVTSVILFSILTPESLSVRARRSEPVPPPPAPAHQP
jgi:cytochrome c oxidase subunit IV